MPNHFHILMTPVVENGISIFMRKIMTGYAMYFNKKYERTGTLFEGKFKARLVDDDVYLKYLFAYIHLNPTKLIQSDWKEKGITDAERAKAYVRKYAHSSYKDCAGESRRESSILNPEAFPEYFTSSDDFEKNVFDWFEQNKQVLPV